MASMGLEVGKPANLPHQPPYLIGGSQRECGQNRLTEIFCLVTTGASYGLGVDQLYKRLGGTPAAKHSRLSSFNSC